MLGVHFIKKGIIGGDTASVLAWLEDRMNYKERFLAANTQTEILNKIYVSKSHMDEDMLEKAKEII